MKGNANKCHLIVSTNEPIEIWVWESLIKNCTCEKLLGVKIDNKLNFDTYVKGLCKKTNNKLRALPKATPKNGQFNYCPLIWMLYSRSNNSKTKHLHELCLRLVYNDKQSS